MLWYHRTSVSRLARVWRLKVTECIFHQSAYKGSRCSAQGNRFEGCMSETGKIRSGRSKRGADSWRLGGLGRTGRVATVRTRPIT